MKLPYYPITPVMIEAGFWKDIRIKSRRPAKLRLLGVTSWRLYPLKDPLALRPPVEARANQLPSLSQSQRISNTKLETKQALSYAIGRTCSLLPLSPPVDFRGTGASESQLGLSEVFPTAGENAIETFGDSASSDWHGESVPIDFFVLNSLSF